VTWSNTAARLQAAAPAGGILVDETTCRATERAIEYGDAAPVVAKGKAQSIVAWLALRARSPVGVERPTGAPLVGRTQELTLLRDTLARVLREREPQLVTLVGVPGIGNSRLVFELFQGLVRDAELVHWLHGRSLPYGEGVTFWALGEMVKAHAGILESDTPEQTEEKLHGAVAAVISEPADADWIERHLRPLSGIETEDTGAGDRTSEAFAAWRRFLEELADERPVVLVFEDLHWADDALLDFVDHLLDWASGVPILVLATARPELVVRRPGWGGGKMNSSTIRLSPLSEAETQTLLHGLLGSSVLSAEAQRNLLARAGGNPLYAQEFVRMLTDRGEELSLPESVQGIIASRRALPAGIPVGRDRKSRPARPLPGQVRGSRGRRPGCARAGPVGAEREPKGGLRPADVRAAARTGPAARGRRSDRARGRRLPRVSRLALRARRRPRATRSYGGRP